MGEIKESEYIRKKISDLKLWDKNPRKIQDKDFDRLKQLYQATANEKALKSAGIHISQIIIWVKNGLVLSHGQLYHRAYEPCMVGWKKGNTSYKNKLVTNLKDVWTLSAQELSEMADVWYEHRDNTSEYEHPTQKPTALAVRGLKRSSQIGDIVLDLFGGSGSTLIACEQNNRICYTMELDPAYCDVIRKRYAMLHGEEEQWEAYTPAQNVTEK
jgi:DNA modification methylase